MDAPKVINLILRKHTQHTLHNVLKLSVGEDCYSLQTFFAY